MSREHANANAVQVDFCLPLTLRVSVAKLESPINLCILVRLCFNQERTVYQGVMIYSMDVSVYGVSAIKACDFGRKLVIKCKKTGKIEENVMHHAMKKYIKSATKYDTCDTGEH